MQKLNENSSGLPDNLRKELDKKFSKTKKDCHYTDFFPCVNCVTTEVKRHTQDMYEKCYPSIEKNILIIAECK